MRLPTASRPRLNFLANASLTIATFGAPERVGARELAAGDQRHADRAEDIPAPTSLSASWCRCPGRPRTPPPRRCCPSCLPASSGTHATADRRHAGQRRQLVLERARTARASAAACSRSARVRRANVIRLSIFRPRSTRLMLSRLLANSPADTSSAIDSAICTVASVARNRCGAVRAADGWPAWLLSVDDQIGSRAVQRREQAEQQARCPAPAPRRTQHRRSSSNVTSRRGLGRQERRDQLERPPRDEQARHAAEHREQAPTRSAAARPAASGWRRSTAAPPSPRRGRRRARAAGWRCSRRR